MDEANIEHFFKPINISRMKSFLEGEGWPIDIKFGDVGLNYREVIVIIAYNSLPHDRLSTVDREALDQRVITVKLDESSHSLQETFPFEATSLAQYFMSGLEQE